MATEIFYFSGTGNSLYVAKELSKKMPSAALTPIISLKNKKNVSVTADIVGFVFPIHFMTAPSIVFEILKKMDLESAKYVFIITTRYGTPCRVMYKIFEKALKEKGNDLNAYSTITMASNDPKFKDYKTLTPEDLNSIENNLQTKLEIISDYINKKEDYREKDLEVTYEVSPFAEKLGVWAISLFGDGKEKFYHDNNCTECGTCEKVCLSGKIKMQEGKPQWQKNHECYSCYACINFCPCLAIQIKAPAFMKFYTSENGRYHHADVGMDKIAGQK